MNLRRRRRARTLALAAFLLAALAWAFSAFFELNWQGQNSNQRRWQEADHPQLSVDDGAVSFTNATGGAPGWIFEFSTRIDYLEWWPRGQIMRNARRGTPTNVFWVVVPLWIPVALTLPLVLLTHTRVRRPLTRLRRGLCHRCAYDLASTPLGSPFPECGSARLALPPRQGRPARPHQPPRPVAALSDAEKAGERGIDQP